MQLHEAIRSARIAGGFSQRRLAKMIGLNQSTVSRWELGETEPTIAEVGQVEEACQLPRGWIFSAADLVLDVMDVVEALEMDHRLTDEQRGMLRALYLQVVGPEAGSATK